MRATYMLYLPHLGAIIARIVPYLPSPEEVVSTEGHSWYIHTGNISESTAQLTALSLWE